MTLVYANIASLSAISCQFLKKLLQSLKNIFLRLKGLKIVLKKVPWFENFSPWFWLKTLLFFPWFHWLEKVFKNFPVFPDFPDRWETCSMHYGPFTWNETKTDTDVLKRLYCLRRSTWKCYTVEVTKRGVPSYHSHVNKEVFEESPHVITGVDLLHLNFCVDITMIQKVHVGVLHLQTV